MLTRRRFLQTGLALVPAGAMLPHVLQRAVYAAALEGVSPQASVSRRTLVLVQLKGGNDGLNTVVPYEDGRYYDLRSSLAVPQEQVLSLDSQVGLHTAMPEFHHLWQEGVLAIVEGVGYPNPSFSHFQSTHVWATADPTSKLADGGDGWLGRYLAALPVQEGHWFRGVSVGGVLPGNLHTPNVPVPAVASLESYRLQSNPRDPMGAQQRVEALLSLYAASPPATPYSAILGGTLEAAYQSSGDLLEAHEAYQPAVEYPEGRFAQGLKLLASAIIQDLGVRVGHITMGGFDTHADQGDGHTELLRTLSQGLHSFYRDLQGHGRDRDVVIMTWSEFGRRVKSNASQGTDHGSAAPLFVLGTPVLGGLYGERPNLGDLDYGNLRFTTDFRYVYKTVLEQWLEAPSDMVLGERGLESLNFLAPS